MWACSGDPKLPAGSGEFLHGLRCVDLSISAEGYVLRTMS